MLVAFESPIGAEVVRSAPERARDETPQLEISVVFTSPRPTLRALKRGSELARRLRARVALVVPQIVPYPLPLATPPVPPQFNERRFFAVAGETRVETTVRIYLCRDRSDCLRDVLKPHSVVFLGGPKRWWPTAEDRLAKRLRRMDHDVVLVDSE